MAISSGTILKVVVSLLLPDSVIAQNVFYSVVVDLVTSDDEDDVVADIIDWVEDMYGDLAAQICNDNTSSDVKVYEYDAIDDDWDEVGTDTWSVTFTNTGEMGPHGVAALVHAKSIDPDVQGSKYIPGLSDASIIISDIGAGLATALATFCGTWVTPFAGTATGGAFAPGVWSTARDVFVLFNGNFVVNGLAAYQRRRRPGAGI